MVAIVADANLSVYLWPGGHGGTSQTSCEYVALAEDVAPEAFVRD